MAPSPWIENRSTAGRLILPRWSELARYRDLAGVLAMREIRVRYKQTLLGVGWAVFQPLAATGVFSLLFGRVAGFKAEGVPYAVLVLCGLVAWTYFAAVLIRCSTILVENEDLVTKVFFPRLLVCMAVVIAGLPDLAIGLVLLGAAVLLSGASVGPEVLLAPVLLLVLVVLAFGLGALMCAVAVAYRDVRHALPYLLQLGLLASPVAYASQLGEDRAGAVYYLNPLAGFLDALRWSLIDGPSPPRAALISLAVGAALVLLGVVVFGRTERRFADVI